MLNLPDESKYDDLNEWLQDVGKRTDEFIDNMLKDFKF